MPRGAGNRNRALEIQSLRVMHKCGGAWHATLTADNGSKSTPLARCASALSHERTHWEGIRHPVQEAGARVVGVAGHL